MSYSPTYAYVDGTVVGVNNQSANDTGARTAINQRTTQADLGSAAFDYDSIQRGEYEPIAGSHQFTTGKVFGRFTDLQVEDRAYFSSEIKANDQTDSIQYQILYHTGDRITLEEAGDVFVTFGGTFVSLENSTTSGGPGRGKWDSPIYLVFFNESTNTKTYVAGTLAWTYEETASASAGTTDPGSGSFAARRWIGWEWMVNNLSAGVYQVAVVVNPKVEQGYCSSRQFTCEVFYL